MSADATIGNRTSLEPRVGVEVTARAARLLLLDEVNAEIDRQSSAWRAADESLASLGLDDGVGVTDCEHVEARNIYEGSHRSLVAAPPDYFPNVCVQSFVFRPDSPQFDFDQLDAVALVLYAEIMVKSGPVPDGGEVVHETIVHRRIERTMEAVNAVIMHDRTLRGTCMPLTSLPRGGVGQPTWLKQERAGAGPRYLWKGARLEYTLQRIANFGS